MRSKPLRQQPKASKFPVTYACQIDLLRILRATLSLITAAEYPEKGSPSSEKVASCIREAISELETSIRTQMKSPQDVDAPGAAPNKEP